MSELGDIGHKVRERVFAWRWKGNLDTESAVSSTFEMEWPRSGRIQEFPEIDRIAWCDLGQARVKIKPAQGPFLDRLGRSGSEPER